MFLAACAPTEFTEPPEVILVDLRPMDVSLFEQRLAVGLRIRNLNDTPMEINGLRFALGLNGKPFAKGTSDHSLTVPRLSDAETEGVASVATADILRQIMGAPDAKGLTYRVSGVLFLSGATRRSIAFDSQGDFDLLSTSSAGKLRGLGQ
ncbi:hypothetical protein CU669_07335 [Paramagnetospirillum kuznetsovii]|uniref:Water stress and hypersensitive response domain-containing protein n=2 Tax=Paramagnetospirillum kuznetsovii TaxID=2053833 RepID=A0A364P067_9PROT|nr:hypothetical protein CU669_07335 [Paramagnetospirillum kuznetsovii]